MDDKRGGKSARHDVARYELRVREHLDARWAEWFDGLTLTHLPDGTTSIQGAVADQAALHGLLQRLRDLGLPLVSVTPSRPDGNDKPSDDRS